MKHLDVRHWTLRALARAAEVGFATVLLSTANAQSVRRHDDTYNQRDASSRYTREALPTGTVLPVRLDGAISSKSAMPGDTFTATVIRGQDDAGLPSGTRIEGIVREAAPTDGKDPGYLDVDFRRILYPDGSSQNITGSLYSLSGKAVKRTNGRLVATVDKGKDRLKFIGIGAGAGLIIGMLTKQNTLLSLLLGAGAGYLYNELGQKATPGDVELKQGQEFGVRLDRQLDFDTGVRRYYRRSDTQNPDRASEAMSAYADQIRVFVGDRAVTFDRNNRPYIRNGTVFLPMAAMGKSAGFDYRYDTSSRTVYARNEAVRAGVGSIDATVNGERRALPAAVEIRNGITFVPLQFIAWAADADVGWDETNGTVQLKPTKR